MKKFRRKIHNPNAGERVQETITADCLREKCANYAGVACGAFEELLQADGKADTGNVVPLKKDATYALYGFICTGGNSEELVAARAEVLKPQVNISMLVAQAGRYGDVPLTIGVNGNKQLYEAPSAVIGE